MEELRLQKYFTMCGIMSRRAAEKAINEGRVKVNGNIAVIGDKVIPDTDIVELDGKTVRLQTTGTTYIMLNKPIGRLDMYSEGLLIFTDDGELANRLMHPSHCFTKKYSVKVKGALNGEDIQRLTSPMELDGYVIRPVEAELIASGKTDRDGQLYSTVMITLHEGRNRQIRKMCEKCGLSVMRLRRTAIGDIKLGDLPPGKWRYLTAKEISYLKDGI